MTVTESVHTHPTLKSKANRHGTGTCIKIDYQINMKIFINIFFLPICHVLCVREIIRTQNLKKIELMSAFIAYHGIS